MNTETPEAAAVSHELVTTVTAILDDGDFRYRGIKAIARTAVLETLAALRSLPVEQAAPSIGLVQGECRWCGIDPTVAAEMTGECIGKDDDHLFMWYPADPSDEGDEL